MEHKQWEEQLKEHWTLHTGNCYCQEDAACDYDTRLKDFIRKTLASQRETLAVEIEGMKDPQHSKLPSSVTWNAALTDAAAHIRKQ